MEINIPDKRMFRVDEVAELLDVSRRTVYGWINQGKLESYRISPFIIRIPRDSLCGFVKKIK